MVERFDAFVEPSRQRKAQDRYLQDRYSRDPQSLRSRSIRTADGRDDDVDSIEKLVQTLEAKGYDMSRGGNSFYSVDSDADDRYKVERELSNLSQSSFGHTRTNSEGSFRSENTDVSPLYPARSSPYRTRDEIPVRREQHSHRPPEKTAYGSRGEVSRRTRAPDDDREDDRQWQQSVKKRARHEQVVPPSRRAQVSSPERERDMPPTSRSKEAKKPRSQARQDDQVRDNQTSRVQSPKHSVPYREKERIPAVSEQSKKSDQRQPPPEPKQDMKKSKPSQSGSRMPEQARSSPQISSSPPKLASSLPYRSRVLQQSRSPPERSPSPTQRSRPPEQPRSLPMPSQVPQQPRSPTHRPVPIQTQLEDDSEYADSARAVSPPTNRRRRAKSPPSPRKPKTKRKGIFSRRPRRTYPTKQQLVEVPDKPPVPPTLPDYLKPLASPRKEDPVPTKPIVTPPRESQNLDKLPASPVRESPIPDQERDLAILRKGIISRALDGSVVDDSVADDSTRRSDGSSTFGEKSIYSDDRSEYTEASTVYTEGTMSVRVPSLWNDLVEEFKLLTGTNEARSVLPPMAQSTDEWDDETFATDDGSQMTDGTQRTDGTHMTNGTRMTNGSQLTTETGKGAPVVTRSTTTAALVAAAGVGALGTSALATQPVSPRPLDAAVPTSPRPTAETIAPVETGISEVEEPKLESKNCETEAPQSPVKVQGCEAEPKLSKKISSGIFSKRKLLKSKTESEKDITYTLMSRKVSTIPPPEKGEVGQKRNSSKSRDDSPLKKRRWFRSTKNRELSSDKIETAAESTSSKDTPPTDASTNSNKIESETKGENETLTSGESKPLGWISDAAFAAVASVGSDAYKAVTSMMSLDDADDMSRKIGLAPKETPPAMRKLQTPTNALFDDTSTIASTVDIPNKRVSRFAGLRRLSPLKRRTADNEVSPRSRLGLVGLLAHKPVLKSNPASPSKSKATSPTVVSQSTMSKNEVDLSNDGHWAFCTGGIAGNPVSDEKESASSSMSMGCFGASAALGLATCGAFQSLQAEERDDSSHNNVGYCGRRFHRDVLPASVDTAAQQEPTPTGNEKAEKRQCAHLHLCSSNHHELESVEGEDTNKNSSPEKTGFFSRIFNRDAQKNRLSQCNTDESDDEDDDDENTEDDEAYDVLEPCFSDEDGDESKVLPLERKDNSSPEPALKGTTSTPKTEATTQNVLSPPKINKPSDAPSVKEDVDAQQQNKGFRIWKPRGRKGLQNAEPAVNTNKEQDGPQNAMVLPQPASKELITTSGASEELEKSKGETKVCASSASKATNDSDKNPRADVSITESVDSRSMDESEQGSMYSEVENTHAQSSMFCAGTLAIFAAPLACTFYSKENASSSDNSIGSESQDTDDKADDSILGDAVNNTVDNNNEGTVEKTTDGNAMEKTVGTTTDETFMEDTVELTLETSETKILSNVVTNLDSQQPKKVMKDQSSVEQDDATTKSDIEEEPEERSDRFFEFITTLCSPRNLSEAEKQENEEKDVGETVEKMVEETAEEEAVAEQVTKEDSKDVQDVNDNQALDADRPSFWRSFTRAKTATVEKEKQPLEVQNTQCSPVFGWSNASAEEKMIEAVASEEKTIGSKAESSKATSFKAESKEATQSSIFKSCGTCAGMTGTNTKEIKVVKSMSSDDTDEDFWKNVGTWEKPVEKPAEKLVEKSIVKKSFWSRSSKEAVKEEEAAAPTWTASWWPFPSTVTTAKDSAPVDTSKSKPEVTDDTEPMETGFCGYCGPKSTDEDTPIKATGSKWRLSVPGISSGAAKANGASGDTDEDTDDEDSVTSADLKKIKNAARVIKRHASKVGLSEKELVDAISDAKAKKEGMLGHVGKMTDDFLQAIETNLSS